MVEGWFAAVQTKRALRARYPERNLHQMRVARVRHTPRARSHLLPGAPDSPDAMGEVNGAGEPRMYVLTSQRVSQVDQRMDRRTTSVQQLQQRHRNEQHARRFSEDAR